MSKRKPGTFDEAIDCLQWDLSDSNYTTDQQKSELRAAIRVLRAVDSCAVTEDSIGLGLFGSERVCRALIRARAVASRRTK